MLSTSTSNISEHDKAFVRISNYFVMHRGKGSALSSADADALDTWIQDGHAWMDILQAIDTAFAKLRTPPSTIRSCGRFLPTDALLDELLGTAAGSNARRGENFLKSFQQWYHPF